MEYYNGSKRCCYENFSNISESAILVPAGAPPIQLQVFERQNVFLASKSNWSLRNEKVLPWTSSKQYEDQTTLAKGLLKKWELEADGLKFKTEPWRIKK